MNSALRHQLAHLDRSLLALMNERARLTGQLSPTDPEHRARVEDLLRRNPGPVGPETVRTVFGALERGDQAVGARP